VLEVMEVTMEVVVIVSVVEVSVVVLVVTRDDGFL